VGRISVLLFVDFGMEDGAIPDVIIKRLKSYWAKVSLV
jgi:hypothetical protein